MSNEDFNIDEIDWEIILPRLFAYANYLLKGKSWVRKESKSYKNGKQVDDYVYEAITKFYENPKKYRPEDGDFISFMKENLIRSLISNDYKSAENKKTINISKQPKASDNNDFYLDLILPALNQYFDDQMDYENIINEVTENVKSDPNAESIFLGLIDGMKRREIIEEFNISSKDYDNGVRRLNTIRKQIAKHYGITTNQL